MGSEMCIRDRSDRNRKFVLLADGGRARDKNCDLDLLGLSRIQICLLYTSDAADERSSVDLGGRRIIKKKIYTSVAVSERASLEIGGLRIAKK